MKKYLIGGSAAIIFSIILMTQLYQHTEIEIVKDIVETVAKTTGLGSKMVEQKIEEKKAAAIEEKKKEMKVEAPKMNVVNTDSIKLADSIAKALVASTMSKPKKKLFNSTVDSSVIKRQQQKQQHILDSIQLAAATASKPKKKLFNSRSDDSNTQKQSLKTENKAGSLKFFEAKLTKAQHFANDDEVTFRSVTAFIVNGNTIPENMIFTAKASVFDEKINFIIKSINSVPIKAQTYWANNEIGIPITQELKHQDGYLMGSSASVKFGYTN